MKWIKASDRLPKINEEYFHCKSYGRPCLFSKAELEMAHLKHKENIFWLDETTPKEPNDERSVARDDHQGGEAGNKTLTSDVEQAALDYAPESGFAAMYKREGFIAGAKWQAKQAGETVKGNVKNLIEWLNQECPPDTVTHELSHDFAENLRKRLNLIYSISPIQNK